jgi:hypothetical protein
MRKTGTDHQAGPDRIALDQDRAGAANTRRSGIFVQAIHDPVYLPAAWYERNALLNLPRAPTLCFRIGCALSRRGSREGQRILSRQLRKYLPRHLSRTGCAEAEISQRKLLDMLDARLHLVFG